MTRDEADLKIGILRDEIQKHDHLYYVLDQPSISDADYDNLMLQLRLLEEEFPELVIPTSPTQRVGGYPSNQFESVNHAFPMLSLGNQFTIEELTNWMSGLPLGVTILGEWKLDGLSLSLTYEDGILTNAVTRGDGMVGEDVTVNAVNVNGIPKKLRNFKSGSVVTIRGEVVVAKKVFSEINDNLEELGMKTFANERNFAAGSLRQKDPKITKERQLSFIAYSCANTADDSSMDHKSSMAWLVNNGFTMVQCFNEFKTPVDVNEVSLAVGTMANNRDKIPFVIDGLVFKVNDYNIQKELGFNSREPRWATAYKFPAMQVTTVLEGIDFQVGRTGNITPVARITPVRVHGVVVSNVTLHNMDEVARLGIGIGSHVILERRGDVIPKIMGLDPNYKDKSIPIAPPVKCPVCSSPVVPRMRKASKGEQELSSVLHCTNTRACIGQLKARLKYFVSDAGLDIEGFGDVTVDQLVEEGKLVRFGDIFRLTYDDLDGLEGFADTSINTLLKKIRVSKVCTQKTFFTALGITGASNGTCRRLVESLGSYEKIITAAAQTLEQLRDIGQDTSVAIIDWFRDNLADVNDLLSFDFQFTDYKGTVAPELKGTFTEKALMKIARRDKLSNDGIDMLRNQWVEWGLHESCEKAEIVQGPLAGQTWVLTGSFTHYTRDDASDKLRALGAKVTDSVSKNTTCVIAGPGAGSKETKAMALGVPVHGEDYLRSIIK